DLPRVRRRIGPPAADVGHRRPPRGSAPGRAARPAAGRRRARPPGGARLRDRGHVQPVPLLPVLIAMPTPTPTPPTTARTPDPLPIRDDGVDLAGHLPPPAPTRAWRRFDRLVVVAFCLGLIVPGLMMAARFRPAAIENRPLLEA